MKREDVTRERLLEVLNEKLHKLEACQEVKSRNLSTTMGHSSGLIREQFPV